MTSKHPWRNEERLRQKYWEEKMTCKEIAKEWGCAPRTVSEWLQRHKIETRQTADYQSGPWRNKETLQDLYINKKLSTYEIGERLGCSESTVGEWLKRHNIESRSEGSGKSRNAPWKDKDKLTRLYLEEGMTTQEIGEKLGCSDSTIRKWLIKFDIPRRYSHPQFKTRKDGYETIRHQHNGKFAIIRVHRLLAYAHGEMTFEELFDETVNVHHKSNIPWDNRPENLEKMAHGNHSSIHNSGEYQPRL